MFVLSSWIIVTWARVKQQECTWVLVDNFFYTPTRFNNPNTSTCRFLSGLEFRGKQCPGKKPEEIWTLHCGLPDDRCHVRYEISCQRIDWTLSCQIIFSQCLMRCLHFHTSDILNFASYVYCSIHRHIITLLLYANGRIFILLKCRSTSLLKAFDMLNPKAIK